ncbi:hypothetical protein QWA68_002352 [Fusarium oxysporum]|nr:hypothetical protein QWA68_002352 [Fusarium oxysporum]
MSSLGDGRIPQQLLRTQLALATDIDELIAYRILSHGEDAGVGTSMRDWLNHPMLTSDDQLAKIIKIEQCTKLSPKLEAGSVAYFRSWPMEARQFQQIIEELRLHGYESSDYTREEVGSEAEKVKEANRETYITGVSAQTVAKSWLNGYSVLALCGQEPPISSINDGAGILSGIRATSSLVRSVLTSMVAMETGVCDASITSLANLFSFNQLFNWPQLAPKHKQRSGDLFDSWLETIRPLIVASLGQHVYAWVCQPSRRQTLPKSLLNEVGIPHLAQILNSTYDAIIIPHLHPGSFARNLSISSLDQVFWYPWVATWVYMDTAIRLLMSHDISYTSRQALHIELHIQVEATLKNAGYFESLQVAKAEFAYTKKRQRLGQPQQKGMHSLHSVSQ